MPNIHISISHRPRLAIVKHRPSPPYTNEQGETFTFSPDTIPVQDEPRGTGKGASFQVLQPWRDYIKKINDEAGAAYALSLNNLWMNKEGVAESVICGGNFVQWDMETDTHVRLVGYKYNQQTDMLDPLRDNWHTQPTRFWKACAIDETGRIINVGQALDVFYPLIAKTESWMNKSDLEMFPPPPNGAKYVLQGVNVWSEYEGVRVPLLYNGEFFENWFKLETKGVIAPV